MKKLLTPLMMGIIVAAAGSAAADSITFYQDDNYRGRNFTADQPVTNFARSGFNDLVHSAVVHEGRWEICIDSELFRFRTNKTKCSLGRFLHDIT